MANPSVTTWNRLEPRPRSIFYGPSLAAQVRDPAWLLFRQWQTGEFAGQDGGSPAFVTIGHTTSQMNDWSSGANGATLDATKPLEKQALAEPFSPKDLALAVEIGQTFRALLVGQGATPAAYTAFSSLPLYQVKAPAAVPYNPVDADTRAFLTICDGQALDGAAIYALGKQGPGAALPGGPTGVTPADTPKVREALRLLVLWVQDVWGDLADQDPPTWTPRRLDYTLQVRAEAPDATGVAFDAHPDRGGELPWSSFDVSPTGVSAPGVAPVSDRTTFVPGHVRFRAMPSPRFWDFETSELALPSVRAESRDVLKVLALDFLLIHGADWFVAPLAQPLGSLRRIDAVVVTDVFGIQASIARADVPTAPPSFSRWTLFAPSTPTALAPYYVCSPTAGTAAVAGAPLESVRFARDEMANMAWAIENATASPVGRPRPGSERDAAQDQSHPVTPVGAGDGTSPLRYQIETKVPVHWVPLLGAGNPVTDLQIAAMVRPPESGTGPFQGVPSLGKILNPTPVVQNYGIADEEVPRDGLTIERVVFRSRWTDGSQHVWIGRRRRTGAGETASALRFDVASMTTT